MIIAMMKMTGTITLVMQSERSPERLMIGKPTGSKGRKKIMESEMEEALECVKLMFERFESL